MGKVLSLLHTPLPVFPQQGSMAKCPSPMRGLASPFCCWVVSPEDLVGECKAETGWGGGGKRVMPLLFLRMGVHGS